MINANIATTKGHASAMLMTILTVAMARRSLVAIVFIATVKEYQEDVGGPRTSASSFIHYRYGFFFFFFLRVPRTTMLFNNKGNIEAKLAHSVNKQIAKFEKSKS